MKSLNSIHDQGDDSRDLKPFSMRRKFFSDHFAPLTSQISIIGSFFMKRNPKQSKSANLANQANFGCFGFLFIENEPIIEI